MPHIPNALFDITAQQIVQLLRIKTGNTSEATLKDITSLSYKQWEERGNKQGLLLQDILVELVLTPKEIEKEACVLLGNILKSYPDWSRKLCFENGYPLHLALKDGKLDMFDLLMEHQAEAGVYSFTENDQGKMEGHILLEVAVSCQKNHRYQEVIMNTALQAYPFAQKDKDFVLIQAVQNKNLGAVRALVQHGATLSYKNSNDAHALTLACAQEPNVTTNNMIRHLLTTKDVELFINEGWDEADPRSAMHNACFYNNVEAIAMLVDKGAWIESPNDKHKRCPTPLMMACYDAQQESIKWLLANGGDARAQDRDGYNALHWLAKIEYHNDTMEEETSATRTCALMLLQAGASLEEKDKAGLTPIDLAERKEKKLLACFLLEQHIRDGIKDVDTKKGKVRQQPPKPHKM